MITQWVHSDCSYPSRDECAMRAFILLLPHRAMDSAMERISCYWLILWLEIPSLFRKMEALFRRKRSLLQISHERRIADIELSIINNDMARHMRRRIIKRRRVHARSVFQHTMMSQVVVLSVPLSFRTPVTP